jgi:hypothetical protein
MRALTALLLSLVLALGSVAMAVAKGQPSMGTPVALCTDAGPVTITLDAEGNPLPAGPHLCPDCLSAATAFVLPDEVRPAVLQRTSRPVTALVAASLPNGVTRVPGHARDPPARAV